MGKTKKSQACLRPLSSLNSIISIYNQQRDLPLSKKKIKEVISFVMQELKIDTDEVHFFFVSTKKISELHKNLFEDPSPTDCITLPLDPLPKQKGSYHILGEAFICPKTALIYCKNKHIDPLHEVYRYIIHCLLHFAGYTDTTVKKRTSMRKKETALLKKIIS